MRSLLSRMGTGLLVAAVSLQGSISVHGAASPSLDKLGKKIENVTFTTAGSKSFALYDLKNKQAIVLVFLSFDCPVSTSYSQPLALLYETYKNKGVAVIGMTTGEEADAGEVVRLAREYKLPFPVFKDARLSAANALKADVTPEAFLLDRHFILRYRGRIDNAYAARLKKNQRVTSHDLRSALDEVLAGKPVRQPATQAVGCSILREGKARPSTGKVTYYRDVLPILQNHCQTCHRPGEVGPFSLMTYKQAVNWASDIQEYTRSRKMPPWKPVEGAAFHNERKLTHKEVATLAAWVDGDTPAGNPKDAPAPRKFPEGWQLGKPDLVLTVPEDFQVGPSGNDIFRCFALPTNLSEDKYIAAVEVRPSNPRVVHHALLFIDPDGQARKLEKKEQVRPKKETELDRGPGYSSRMGIGFRPRSGMGGWAPGNMPRYLPDGTGYLLPKNSDVVLQIHYHRDGRVEKDRTALGLYFARKPVRTPYRSLTLAGLSKDGWGLYFSIPARNPDYILEGNAWVEQDCTVYSVMPHMHLLGKKIKVTLTPPEGKMQTLVAIRDWDYNWQETYVFKIPLKVKAGTRFTVSAHYDNSAKNPNNPNNPPRDVGYGQQTTDEMCFVFLGVTPDRPGRLRVRYTPPKKPVKKTEQKAKP
jgi:peroxiredoxin